MNGPEPATKQDLQIMADQLRSELHATADQLRDDLKEAIRDSQTELSKAFYSFTTSYQERLTQTEANDSNIMKRLGILEARVTELERKVNFPKFPNQ